MLAAWLMAMVREVEGFRSVLRFEMIERALKSFKGIGKGETAYPVVYLELKRML